MPVIDIDKDSKFKQLSKTDRDDLAGKISGWWGEFQDKRTSQLDTAEKLSKYIYLNQSDRNKSAKWKANIKENKVYTTYDSMKSVMWKEIWSNEGQMFDVVGMSKEYEEVAEEQKQAIVHALKIMDAGVQFDLATDYWMLFGDFIYKTDWKRRSKKVKRFDAYAGMVEQEIPLEDNANIEAINPMFFNFDVTKYKYGDEKSWGQRRERHQICLFNLFNEQLSSL